MSLGFTVLDCHVFARLTYVLADEPALKGLELLVSSNDMSSHSYHYIRRSHLANRRLFGSYMECAFLRLRLTNDSATEELLSVKDDGARQHPINRARCLSKLIRFLKLRLLACTRYSFYVACSKQRAMYFRRRKSVPEPRGTCRRSTLRVVLQLLR